ncbi:MAG: hypothetical protein PF961_13265 [Planctomycetota bacterium]|jgi:hypothetical protein|nr:hypothetical protein [Planctomycetota bacterium]
MRTGLQLYRIVMLTVAVAIAALSAQDTVAVPAGTSITASFRTDQGPERLIDGDEATYMVGAGGQVTKGGQTTSVFLRFAKPLVNLGGVVTGASDKFHNYYPQEMEFWADSDGDGRFDTKLGMTEKLGPAEQCRGTHAFAGRLPQVHALELRVTKQHTGGGARPWTMSEVKLVLDASLPVLKATPGAHRVSFYELPIPSGTTATSSFATEDNGSAVNLLDGVNDSYMTGKGGTAATASKPASVYLRFPEPQRDLAGIVLGKGDKYGNYVWKTVEFWGDTNGDGRYDSKLGQAKGGGIGRKKFSKPAAEVHGLELRVTDQKSAGGRRAWSMNEIPSLVFRDELGATEMRYVVEDFEDFNTWRTWGTSTGQPEGERYYGGYVFLAGELAPAKAKHGDGVGVFRYLFKDSNKPKRLWCKKGVVAAREAMIDAITMDMNPQGYSGKIWFELLDSKGKKGSTPKVTFAGDGWQSLRIDCTPAAMPAAGAMVPPMKILHIFMEGDASGGGDLLLDDITVVGAVDRTKRITIQPVWDGLGHDPTKPVTVRYRVRNALPDPITAPLQLRCFSSFDHARTKPVFAETKSVTVPGYGDIVIAFNLGATGVGHFVSDLALDAEGVRARCEDVFGVFAPNGKRINQSAMWFGGQHHGDWVSAIENDFRFDRVVKEIGMDCYRTSSPKVAKRGLLAAAGFGGMPPELRTKDMKNDNRGAPNDYQAYYEWCKEEAREKFLPYADSILSIEFYNEPDLPDFCYIPEIDTYLKMHDAFARAFREVIPGVQIGTGSVTVGHGKEKKDFTPRMFTESDYDVGVWHAHGELDAYIARHRQVEAYMKKKGLAEADMKLGNSEAGWVSNHDAKGRLIQADLLVKKIGWAKSQASSLFYTWFTTGDIIDPQHGITDFQSWGLVDHRQRCKPSGQAYNELIKRLSNTEGRGEVDLGRKVDAVHFNRTSDGAYVVLVWPESRGDFVVLPLAADGPVVVSDMFGRDTTLQPSGGRVSVELRGYPVYVTAPKGVTMGKAGASQALQHPANVAVGTDNTVAFSCTIRNVWNKDVTLDLSIRAADGTVRYQQQVAVATGAEVVQAISLSMPADLPEGAHGHVLTVRDVAQGLEDAQSLAVVKAPILPKISGPFTMDGAVDKLSASADITLASKDDTVDLVFDPDTPFWANPDDLSVVARFAHDGAGIYASFVVKDQTHQPGTSDSKMWAHDGIQFQIVSDGGTVQLGLVEGAGGAGWTWRHAQPEHVGTLAQPLAVKRAGASTVYECYLPFDYLGISYEPGKVIRAAFVVNEDDGRNRVRVMRWYDGIATQHGKGSDVMGYLMLE